MHRRPTRPRSYHKHTPRPEANTPPVTIVFRARGENGNWKTVHELHHSNSSEVERVARKDARNRQATFYDKDLRRLTPAQCFEAAIEDGSNTIIMQLHGELTIDEETMESTSRDLEFPSSNVALKTWISNPYRSQAYRVASWRPGSPTGSWATDSEPTRIVGSRHSDYDESPWISIPSIWALTL
ncbi:hypothetical protein ETB97_002400 [Aspergillus alliaceus]|uniref:Uncharacterized protein n=1 Tax=Petromyces alliaceus TaxID=209559 RepID=A0A8H6E633_PETAA|nr:hypothetical protein ETB97_002400 [Aspergillus burnettii]